MLDSIFFTLLFVSERKQIAMIADEKSTTRISHRIFATSRSEMEIIMIKNVLEYLEQSAAKSPDKTAVADEHNAFTYQELLDNAQRVGAVLQKETPVRTAVPPLMPGKGICPGAPSSSMLRMSAGVIS